MAGIAFDEQDEHSGSVSDGYAHSSAPAFSSGAGAGAASAGNRADEEASGGGFERRVGDGIFRGGNEFSDSRFLFR